MTKKYEIRDYGNLFSVWKNDEPLTTRFEYEDRDDVVNLVDELNSLTAKNKVLCKEIERLRTQNKDLLYSNAKNMELLEKENKELQEQIAEQGTQLDFLKDENKHMRKVLEENKELKAKVDDKEVAVEVECEKLMQKVLDLIDRKIKLYSHKPVSAPISQPMSVNFDEDVDRLARLSELEALKEELQE